LECLSTTIVLPDSDGVCQFVRSMPCWTRGPVQASESSPHLSRLHRGPQVGEVLGDPLTPAVLSDDRLGWKAARQPGGIASALRQTRLYESFHAADLSDSRLIPELLCRRKWGAELSRHGGNQALCGTGTGASLSAGPGEGIDWSQLKHGARLAATVAAGVSRSGGI
jgi:hypothetical protein